MTVQPGEEKAQGDLIKILEGRDEGKGARLFSVVSTDRTRGNEKKLKHKIFHLNTKNPTFLTVSVVKHWNRLPSEIVESPSVEVLKTLLDTVLDNLL